MSVSFKPQAITSIAGLVLVLAVLASTARATQPANSQAAPSGYTYVEAMVGAPRFVNPLLATSDTDTDLAHLVFSGLTRVDRQGNIVPDLAAGWQTSPDSRVFTFTLKPNLKWQDGESLTADDVVFTLGLLRDKDFPGDPGLARTWQDVQINSTGPQQVSFTLPKPNSAFIEYTTLGILPKHLWAGVKVADMEASELNQMPVGSGPWRYATTQPPQESDTTAQSTPVSGGITTNDGALLEPNPYLPSPGQNRSISRLWFRLYPTFGAALTAFKRGEVHALGHIPDSQLSEVAAVPGATLRTQTLARYEMLVLNVQSPLFDKPETRQAVQLAVNRQALVAQSLNGQARAAYSPVLPQSWAYDASLNYPPYDPAQAGQLLDKAGWVMGPGGVRTRDGLTMTVVLTVNKDVPSNVAVAQQIADDLRAVGMDIKLAAVSRDTLLKDYLGPRAFHMALVGWEAQGADPDLFAYWHSSQATAVGGLNFSGWSNPQADKALQDALATSNKAARTQDYAAFQQAFLQDNPAIILYTPLYTYATRSPATGITLPTTDLLSPPYRFDTLGDWSLEITGGR